MVIKETFLEAGVSSSGISPSSSLSLIFEALGLLYLYIELSRVQNQLSKILIERFWSREGYSIHIEIIPTLLYLAFRSKSSNILSPGIVSGSDRGAIKVLQDLAVISSSEEKDGSFEWQIKEKNVLTTWDLEAEKKSGVFWERVFIKVNEEAKEEGKRKLERDEILVVGDNYKEWVPSTITVPK